MISKNEVKYIQSLYDKKNRDEEGLFIAEGPKLVKELLESNLIIKNIFATNEWIKQNISDSIVKEISPDELKSISNLQTPNQVLAVVQKKPVLSVPGLEEKLSLMLDGIQDPGNFGTIIRIADWFGIDTIFASGDTADVYNPKVIQSTMGSFIRINIFYGHLKNILKQAFLLPVYGAMLNGKSVYEMKQIKEGIIVIGNESKGIRYNILPYIFHPITIPQKGKAESLNAAIATGIILSHLVH
ncbi:MAG: TrmH family RNA methyltransferase [Chitinophagaceae bacterium]